MIGMIKEFSAVIAVVVGVVLNEITHIFRNYTKNKAAKEITENKRHLMLCKLNYELKKHLRKVSISSVNNEITATIIEEEIDEFVELIEKYNVEELSLESQKRYFDFLNKIGSNYEMLEYKKIRAMMGLC